MESGTGGLTARVAWAVLCAIIGGLWLGRSLRTPHAQEGRWSPLLQSLALALSAFWSAVWLAIALIRLRSPFELEWSCGAIRDMAVRAMLGQPLYVAPGGGWFPYEYPPLFAWLSGGMMRVTGVSYIPMRLISILSTLGCAWIIYAWANGMSPIRNPQTDSPSVAGESRPAIRNQAWSLLAPGLFLAAYRLTGAWYDIERIDMLFLLLSLVGIYWLHLGVTRNKLAWTAASAIAFALAFLTKQQAILFVAGGIAALLWLRRSRYAALFAGLTFMLCGGAALAMNAATDGWFSYYCFRVPLANGIKPHLAIHYIPSDLALYAPILAICVLAANSLRRDLQPRSDPPLVLLAWMTTMAIAGSMLSRAHWGGDQNVLIPEYVFLGIAACVLAGRLAATTPAARSPLCALIIAQLVTLTYRPQAQLPTDMGRAAGERYASLIRGLEREGEVLCLDHGGFTSVPHFQILGLMDVMNTEKGLPAALTDALRSHRYAAIVSDAEPTSEGPLGEILRDYPHIERVDITQTWAVTGFLTPNAVWRVWVLRP